jgi:ATP-dependent 26S proteasome regulatory subunit
MDRAKKKDIMDDLDAFRSNRDFYRRTGKPWKRGYLLYGPPGTGKSTMVAAMANYLDYDIYDVELTVVNTNTDLRRLLIETTSKSIIVIEDIDCSLDITGDRAARQRRRPGGGPPKDDDDRPRNTVTLSGLLNFIDGLWSACGGERIVVFTTNHVDKLDPALIRRGRMDKHIEMSYCRYEAFKVLANNYLDITEHNFFERYGEIQQLLEEIDMSPADVAENMMAMSTEKVDAGKYLAGLVAALKKAKMEAAVKEVAVNAQEEAKVVVEKGVEKSMHGERGEGSNGQGE